MNRDKENAHQYHIIFMTFESFFMCKAIPIALKKPLKHILINVLFGNQYIGFAALLV